MFWVGNHNTDIYEDDHHAIFLAHWPSHWCYGAFHGASLASHLGSKGNRSQAGILSCRARNIYGPLIVTLFFRLSKLKDPKRVKYSIKPGAFGIVMI